MLKKQILPSGDYLDKNDGNIKVGCKAGVFSPDIFTSETSWCARGCQGLDPTFLRSVDLLTVTLSQTPVKSKRLFKPIPLVYSVSKLHVKTPSQTCTFEAR